MVPLTEAVSAVQVLAMGFAFVATLSVGGWAIAHGHKRWDATPRASLVLVGWLLACFTALIAAEAWRQFSHVRIEWLS